MKKIENNFAVTGFVGKDAEIRQFTTASVARFSLAIACNEKNVEENSRVSAFINVEAWRKNENAESFDKLIKGAMFTVEGTISTSQWKDRQGESHTQISINADSIAFVNTGKKEEQNTDPKKAAKKGAKTKSTPQPPQDAPEPDEKDLPF